MTPPVSRWDAERLLDEAGRVNTIRLAKAIVSDGEPDGSVVRVLDRELKGLAALALLGCVATQPDPAKCDHDTTCCRCGTRWPPQAEVIRDRQAIAAAMEDTVG